jgi:pimeloyl-ACP methyl ester carboxylesterase
MTSETQIIKANGINLSVTIRGKGPGVILLHGFPDSGLLWRDQIDPLVQRGYRIIVPDLRGCGDSDAPVGKSNYILDTLVKDVIAMMDHFRIDQATVIGHDWGAILGWHVAIAHPERVNRYVALSVGHPLSFKMGGIEQKLRSWYAVFFAFPFISEFIIRSFNWHFFRLLVQNHPETDQWIKDKSRPGRLTAALNWYRANLWRALFGSTENLKVPAFGIWSTKDIYLTEKQMLMSGAYVEAPWQYERIENSGHWIPLDAPDRLSRLLIDCLGQPLK